jgi:hypothetical protein
MSELNYAGEYDLLELNLHSSSGNVVNLENSYREINLFENMFSNTITGTILVLDIDNIIMNLPVVGQEYLSFKIQTPTLEDHAIDYTKHLMSVYKIDSRLPNKNAEAFMLHFCSPELLKNKRIRLSKSYTESTDKIVTDILQNEKSINTGKSLFIEGTKGIKKIISPNKTPYGLISDLATDSISAVNDSPNYVFFENTKGIHFRTLESLYNEPSIGEFISSDDGAIDIQKGGVMDISTKLKQVLQYTISSNNDTMKSIESGMLASKTIEYNIFQKKYNVNYYNYFTDFYKNKRVSDDRGKDNPIYNETPIDESGKTMGDYSDAKIFLQPTSKNSTGNDAQHDGSYEPNNVAKTISSRNSKHTELEHGVKIIMKINGTTTLYVGAIIDFILPIVGKNHQDEEFDLYNSGRFLITKLRHVFTRTGTQHKIFMTAVKDSVNTGLPQNTKQLQPSTDGGSITQL